MSDLKPFQKATVDVVLKAFSRKGGTRRFLIADEVGLGKTLVAGEIIRQMAKSKAQPLVVLYVCSNLSIAAQNKKNLLKWLSKEERKASVSRVDRLTLLPEFKAPSGTEVNLYTLTPDTSIPMRGSRRSDGKKEERALIHALVKNICPEFFQGRSSSYFKGSVGSNVWKDLINKKCTFVNQSANNLCQMFLDSLRKELGLTDGMNVTDALNQIEAENEGNGKSKLIALLRNALAAGAIEQLKPDLVIFDEFQRFRDLLQDDIDTAASRVIGALRGDNSLNQLKLLLLSATPYRPYTRQWEDDRDHSHRKEFFELLNFLYKRTEKAKHIAKKCTDALLIMEQELRKGNLGSDDYEESRKIMERYLREVMCRTERASHTVKLLELSTSRWPADLKASDLKVFRHMVQSFQQPHKSAATPYWSSIPLPMQTMGPGYQTWKLAEAITDPSVQCLSKQQRDDFKKLLDPAHPRLRALKSMLPIERIALPWLAPSAPWWPLKGLWKSNNGSLGKVLIFSRFRAVPQAIASLMSYDVEAHFLAFDIKYDELTKRRGLQPKAGNEALLGHFYPSLFLIKNTDPIAKGVGSLKRAKESVEKQLRKALKLLGIQIKGGKRRRPTWSLIAALERKQLGSMEAVEQIVKSWSLIHSTAKIQSSEDSETGFQTMLKNWLQASEHEISEVSPAEFKDLAMYALSAPGVVIGRALARHWSEALENDKFLKCIEVSWKGLRNYLSSRLFMKALARHEKRYPETIRKAALDGNLESVLDEHLWITSKVGNATGEKLADELLDALQLRTSNFFMHALGSKSKRDRFSLRCHAVMPFTDVRSNNASLLPFENGEKPIHADELRKAFNTPFWPHVLATTSVGQEGLDFHVWCDTLLHWDLCNNPVDMEQREGRIRRYGGLAVRRKLTQLLWNKGIQLATKESPWAKLEKIAEREHTDSTGLSPWWVCEGADIKRLIIDLPASEQRHQLEVLRQQRLLYRLALGQPNQEDLLEVLSGKYPDNVVLENIGLNLSPFFHQGRGTESTKI